MVIRQLTATNFNALVKDSGKVSVVKFWHHECHMCKALQPIYERLAGQYQEKFNFFEVNTMVDQRLARDLFDIEGAPEIYFVNGDKLEEIPFPEIPGPSGYPEAYLDYYFLRYQILNRDPERGP